MKALVRCCGQRLAYVSIADIRAERSQGGQAGGGVEDHEWVSAMVCQSRAWRNDAGYPGELVKHHQHIRAGSAPQVRRLTLSIRALPI